MSDRPLGIPGGFTIHNTTSGKVATSYTLQKSKELVRWHYEKRKGRFGFEVRKGGRIVLKLPRTR